MLAASWSTDLSYSFYSDINLFLIDDAWRKLYNIRLLLWENKSRTIVIQELNTGRKGKVLSVITKDRVIEGNLKRQIKNQTFYTCRFFLPS